MKDSTIAIHHGFSSDPTTHSSAIPIYQTVAYTFDDAQHGADLFNLSVPGNIYTRIMNPTNDILEKRVAALEGGIAAVAVASGSAAVFYAIETIAQFGDNIVSTPNLYGGTYALFTQTFPRSGIKVHLAEDHTIEALERLIDKNTKALFCESITNPSGRIADLSALADLAHRYGIPLIVDNTVATPALCKPFEFGADIVVHSLTKYIGGHGNSIAGAVVDSGRFDWKANTAHFPLLNKPEAAYHGTVFSEAFGAAAYIARLRTVNLRDTGAALSPFNAFLILQGLMTLELRMKQHVKNAAAVAEYLSKHQNVSWVSYAGLPDHSDYELSKRYCKGTPSAILSFGVKGGYPAAVAFYNKLGLFKRLVNIGDVSSLACHPASTTHSQMDEAGLAKAGVPPELIRLSIGIEDIEDILADLAQALETK